MKGIEGFMLGRYELRRRIAQGGMAEVYLAFDKRVRRQVAIKVLYGRDESFVRRFEREALAVGALSHDHILPLYDYGEQRPWYYLVMPYVEGGTLRDYMLKREQLTLEETASFIDQIASALQYAHNQGMMHRDVKPSNILLRPDGYAYLVDFGLAKALMGAESLTTSGAMIGTPEYMAPEQSNGVNDFRSDIYALGVISYQMLTGRVPFMAESPVAVSLKHIQVQPTPPRLLNSQIPQGVEDVILKALAKAPDERFQEAQSFSTAYWKALHRAKLQSGTSPSLTAEAQKAVNETPTEDTEEHADQPADTAIKHLHDTKSSHSHIHTFVTPLLYPLRRSRTPSISSSSIRPDINFHSRASRPRHLRSIAVALVCLLLLTLVTTLGITWKVQQAHSFASITANTMRENTSQIGIELSATAQAKALALKEEQAQATLAAQARVQATAGITSALSTGNVLYADAMTTPGGGWINDGYQCFFSPEGYHVRTFTLYTMAWCYSNQQQYSSAIFTVQAELLHGDIYGLVFRLSPANQEFYVLEINSEGEYRFVRAWGSNPFNWLTLIDWTRSNAIVSGYNHLNTILVIARGPNFRFYINKQLIVTSFSDSVYSSGLIGLLVGGDSPGGTEAVFSNMWVFQ
jgi:serine/threonine protein kinase